MFNLDLDFTLPHESTYLRHVFYVISIYCIYSVERSKDEEETSVAKLFTGSLSTLKKWYVKL